MRIWIDALARDACAGAGAGLRALDRAIIGVFTIITKKLSTPPARDRCPGLVIEEGARGCLGWLRLDECSCALLGLGPREVVRPLPLQQSFLSHLASRVTLTAGASVATACKAAPAWS